MSNARAKKQEKELAKQLGGRAIPASGALWHSKGDVENDVFLVECKYTDKNFYNFKLSEWEKHSKEAIKRSLRTPVFSIIFNANSREKLNMYVFAEKDIPAGLFTNVDYLGRTEKQRKLMPEENESISFCLNKTRFLMLSEYAFSLLRFDIDKM